MKDLKTAKNLPRAGSMAAYPTHVYLNGEIVDASEAKVSVFDRGFIFGDGIYEVMARIGGHFFYGDAHWERLDSCLQKIGLSFDIASLKAAVPAVLEASGIEDEDCMIYIQVTRGIAPRQHGYPPDPQPTAMMYAWKKSLPPIETKHSRVVTLEDFRWSRCDIKMTSLLGNVMANQWAMEQDAYETVLIRNGVITEASHCNVFFVKDQTVWTHPADAFILDGITRQVVLEICEALNIPARIEGVPTDRLTQMDEAFLTGTGSQVRAIRQLDDHHYFDAQPGPVTRRIQEVFLEWKYRT